MAPRINWRKFEINSTYRGDFFPDIDFGSMNTIDKKQLISYNAVAVTGGTVFVVIGGGVGIGFKHLLSSQIKADNADGYLIILASACYTIASLIALLLPKNAIGPPGCPLLFSCSLRPMGFPSLL